MSASNGQAKVIIDASDDAALRRAALVNITIETISTLIFLALVVSQVKGDKVAFKISRTLKRWRKKLAPTYVNKDDMKRYESLLLIEARRILRGADQ